ncbi:MAG: hypothetical protein ABWX70_10520 [Hyphomicrobium sp.]
MPLHFSYGPVTEKVRLGDNDFDRLEDPHSSAGDNGTCNFSGDRDFPKSSQPAKKAFFFLVGSISGAQRPAVDPSSCPELLMASATWSRTTRTSPAPLVYVESPPIHDDEHVNREKGLKKLMAAKPWRMSACLSAMLGVDWSINILREACKRRPSNIVVFSDVNWKGSERLKAKPRTLGPEKPLVCAGGMRRHGRARHG